VSEIDDLQRHLNEDAIDRTVMIKVLRRGRLHEFEIVPRESTRR
jgi:hypothetical protein